MAGEDDSNRSRNTPSANSRQWPDDDNPFVAFRRFADEQISSMLQSVTGLPSLASRPRSEHWAIFEERNYPDAHIRHRQGLNGNDGTAEQGDFPSDLASQSSGQDNSNNRNNSFPPRPADPSRWFEPGRPFDVDSFFDLAFGRSFVDDYFFSRSFFPRHPPLFDRILSADNAAWPIPYLMFSPYSPLHLERQSRYRSQNEGGVFSSIMSSLSLSSEYDREEPKWREAFEDLLRLENGKTMLDREPSAVAKPESSTEWLHGLVKRGSLGDRWKFVAGAEGQPWSGITLQRTERPRYLPEAEKSDTVAKTDEANFVPDTELDMYERFLRDIEAREREFLGPSYHSPLLRFLLEDRRSFKELDLLPERAKTDMKGWLEDLSEESKALAAAYDSAEKSSQNSTSVPAETPSENKPYVVSTQVSTERVRLPDGSIQTKTVKTKRFSDGREETNESTEVVNPPQRDQISNPVEQKKDGWFWKD